MSKGELSKANILNQAVQLGSVYGLRGLTIGNLAQHTGMSKGGICAHFASKQLLQLATIEQASQIFVGAVIKPTLAHPTGVERLQALGNAWLAYLDNGVFLGGCFFTNVLLENDDVDDEMVRSTVRHHYRGFLDFLQKEFTAAQHLGQFRATATSEAYAFEFMGILLSALVWRGLNRQQEGIALARALLAALIARAKA